MSKHRRQLLERSYEWIRGHLHATNLDVPDEFIEAWIFGDEDREAQRPAGFHFSVFAFGFLQHEALGGALPPSKPRTVALGRILERFDRWQFKLALAEVHRRTEVRVEPMPLFTFAEDENVTVWRKS